VEYPYYNSTTSYFPIRRAANETQYVLGRAFLQEAYVIVDWERQNFTLGPSLHRNGVSNNIVPILSPDAITPKSSGGLGSGAIAGIVIGAVAAFVIAILLGWFVWRRRQRLRGPMGTLTAMEEQTVDGKGGKEVSIESDGDSSAHMACKQSSLPARTPAELMSEEYFEAPSTGLAHQLMSSAVYELPGHSVEQELPTTAGGRSK